jgi:hypothetical protein
MLRLCVSNIESAQRDAYRQYSGLAWSGRNVSLRVLFDLATNVALGLILCKLRQCITSVTFVTVLYYPQSIEIIISIYTQLRRKDENLQK